jgi:hypothetical protein
LETGDCCGKLNVVVELVFLENEEVCVMVAKGVELDVGVGEMEVVDGEELEGGAVLWLL